LEFQTIELLQWEFLSCYRGQMMVVLGQMRFPSLSDYPKRDHRMEWKMSAATLQLHNQHYLLKLAPLELSSLPKNFDCQHYQPWIVTRVTF
jgi:hypothetical protein